MSIELCIIKGSLQVNSAWFNTAFDDGFTGLNYLGYRYVQPYPMVSYYSEKQLLHWSIFE